VDERLKISMDQTRNRTSGVPWERLRLSHNGLGSSLHTKMSTVRISHRNPKRLSLGCRSDDTIFTLFSLGVVTSRDDWAYDFARESLSEKMKRLIKNYIRGFQTVTRRFCSKRD